jgi:hypothetical protein
MEMIFCPNCNKLTGYKRLLGFGTFFAVLLTAGFWLLTIPFYPKRCITCGLSKSDSVPWYRTWRLSVFVLFAGGLILSLIFFVDKVFFKPNGRSRQGWANASLLGFRGGDSLQDVGGHAADMGFTKVSDCKTRQFEGDPPDTDYTDCKFSGKARESMEASFYRGQLQRIEYHFPATRYGEILEAIKKANGNPRYTDPADPSHAFWGTFDDHFDISTDKDAAQGWASITFDTPESIQDRENMKKAYVPPQGIPSQAVPEVNKAERRLFGEKTADVDALEVTSEALEGSVAIMTRCKAHFCPDHYAVWTVDLSTGQAAGVLADESEIAVYLGDYASAQKLPSRLLSEIQRYEEGSPSPKRIRYISQGQ